MYAMIFITRRLLLVCCSQHIHLCNEEAWDKNFATEACMQQHSDIVAFLVLLVMEQLHNR